MVWKYLEGIASLLEDDERQSVLGDIQERGTTLRSLLDLLGLVALRQLQYLRRLDTWVLAAIFFLPTFAAVSGVLVFADVVALHPTLLSLPYFLGGELSTLISILALSWAGGFALTSLSRHRAVALMGLTCVAVTWLQSDSQTPAWVDLTALFVFMGIPGSLGLARGRKIAPLSPKSRIWIVALRVPILVLVGSRYPLKELGLVVAAFWPAFYAVKSKRTEVEL